MKIELNDGAAITICVVAFLACMVLIAIFDK